MKMYVGNLSYEVGNDELRALFEQYGPVHSAQVILDHDTGRSKGFGFVEMGDTDGQKAMESLDQSGHMGRRIVVNVAKPREPSPRHDRGGGDRRHRR